MIALIRLARWFPPRVRLFCVNAVASAAYHLSRSKRRACKQILSQIFDGKLSKDRIQSIVKSSFHQFWLEAFSMHSPRYVSSRTRFEIRGLQYLKNVLGTGKGAILWHSDSFGRNFLAKQMLHDHGFAVYQIYGENHAGGFASPCPASWLRRRIITPLFDRCEQPYVAEILSLPLWEPLPVMRVLFDRLKQNAIICVAGDGNLGWNSVRKNFLGGYNTFFTGMASLSRVTGAPILPLFCVQEDSDKTAVIIESPIALDSTKDRDSALESCIDQYVSLLESYIKRYPEQYRHWDGLAKFFSADAGPISSAG